MNKDLHKDTQKTVLTKDTSLSSTGKHGGRSFQAFNPRAPSFIPSGAGFAKLAKQATQHPHGNEDTHAGRGRGRKGGPMGQEGGLSRALRSKGQHVSPHVPPQRPPLQHSAPPAEVSPLGRSPSGRKFVAANHLLNLQYDSRTAGRTSGLLSRGRGGRRGTPRVQPYNRNKFLQANFRFLVSDAADLRAHAADPDLMLDWSDVLEVEMLVPSPLRCPISLESPPLCPQITPCGHVFSFPAIMAHLMTHGGDALRKASPCPLCTAPIVSRELRLVRAHIVEPPQVGKEGDFTLLKRPRESIIPVQIFANSPSEDQAHRDAETFNAWASCPADPLKRSGAEHMSDGKAAGGHVEAHLQAPWEYNRFAKFTVVPNPAPLWAAAAVQLSDYAAQVTAEGGRDAAQEAPYIFAAMDALAGRAASWAERRQRTLLDQQDLEAGEKGYATSGSTPQEAASAAAAAVKRITTATVQSAAEQRSREAAEQERLRSFPSLGVGPPPVAAAGGAPPPTPNPAQRLTSHAAASRDQNYEAAFSEEDSPRGEPQQLNAVIEAVQAGAGEACLAHQPSAEAEEAEGRIEEETLGTSPSNAVNLPHPPAAELFFYQATDGQWLFLHPLLMRILLEHYGGYESLPNSLAGTLLEVEPQVQTEALRKRHKFLGHLPLGGAYAMGEIDLSHSLPQEALASFSKELATRAQRREARLAEEARQDARDAARAEVERRRAAGPSVTELRAMPQPGKPAFGAPPPRSESADVDEALALSLAELDDGEGGWGDSPPPEPPQAGVSFAHMAKMGFAASGPALSSTPPAPQAPVWGPSLSRNTTPEAAATPSGSYPPWGGNAGGDNSAPRGTLASRLAEAEAARQKNKEPEASSAHGKGKKGKQLVLLGMQNRRY